MILGSSLSLLIAYINGFPLVYSDTGAYIDMGFKNRLPVDRSIYYGLFIRHISLATFPWLVVACQSLLVNISILEFLKTVMPDRFALAYILTLPVITLTTAYSYTTSVLLPDIFTSTAFLCFLTFLFRSKASIFWKTAIGFLLIFSIGSHLSHIPIFISLSIVLLIAAWVFKRLKGLALFDKKRFAQLMGIILIAIFCVPATNLLVGGKFRFHKSEHAFAIYHLIEVGVLQDYLKVNCKTGDEFLLCPYRDELGYNFLWDPASPLYKTGGKKSNASDFARIMHDIYTTPKYLAQIFLASFEFGAKQFVNFSPAVMEPQLEGSAPYGQIHWRFNNSLDNYISSKQNTSLVNTSIIAGIQPFVVYISLLLIIMMIVLKSKNMEKYQPTYSSAVALCLFLMLSSYICANLSTIDDRYQSRIIWLAPMFAIIFTIAQLNPDNAIDESPR